MLQLSSLQHLDCRLKLNIIVRDERWLTDQVLLFSKTLIVIAAQLMIFLQFYVVLIKSFFTYGRVYGTIHLEVFFNPIQDEGGGKAPYQFFPCNFYKCRN